MDFAEFAIAEGGAKFCSLKATSSGSYPAGEADLKAAYAFTINPRDRYLVVRAMGQTVLLIRRSIMTPWVHRVSYPSTVLQYIGDVFLTLLIAAGGIVLLMLGIFLFA